MNSWLKTLHHGLLPNACLLCGAAAGPLPNLCPACAAELPWIPVGCPACAMPGPWPTACPSCQRRPPPHARAFCPLRYEAPVSVLIQWFKFQGHLAAGDTLARLLARHLDRALDARPECIPDCIVPVPLHPGRLRERGYNQALELARPLAASLAIALRPGALRRVRATAPQARAQTPAERRRNVRGAFRAGPAVAELAHAAVVDDVLTTGATAAEATRALRRAGVARVDVWAVARAG